MSFMDACVFHDPVAICHNPVRPCHALYPPCIAVAITAIAAGCLLFDRVLLSPRSCACAAAANDDGEDVERDEFSRRLVRDIRTAPLFELIHTLPKQQLRMIDM
jgi:hypothetical protein